MTAAIIGIVVLSIIMPFSYLGLREVYQMIEWSYEALPKLRSRPHRFSGRIILALTSPIAGVFIFSARNKPLAMLAFRSGMCVTFIDSLLKQKIISDDEANTIYEQLVQRIQNA